ncbi:aminotransferase class V-fold PLP-dependent enzyme [Simiduia agarivorans]|uniref:Kynureninase n=1 Tax=Simiduia agarivorans (strain DSM 21679 / JCM 13881 / BCRC 17597 / SA1) TaxID=1117647 RepID=K4KN23_SIMAS|nr:aminotransferase class V-fold PLP-dependent enzyme [Simiduia agarivorans]AFV00575.1 kynureninase [Simiduia agarivorans SA1 = DSM 21679]
MPLSIEDLQKPVNPLADDYRHFRVADRLLLTGHSHQAWPDCAFSAQQQAWLDAAEYVDDKWALAAEKADQVKAGFARLLNEPAADIALGQNTHELVLRFLSALDLNARPRLITTDSEFHTLRRQLNRLKETGVELVVVPQVPMQSLAGRIIDAMDDSTAAVMVSQVFFNSGRIFADLPAVAEAANRKGIPLLVDVYHALNVVPVDVQAMGLVQAFIVGGGYKYCQLGEGNCFLRVPPGCDWRPVNTGWYAEFALLESSHGDQVQYGKGAAAFAGSTYDPTSHYRAAAVFDFFQQRALTPALLRQISQHQTGVLLDCFDALNLPETIGPDRAMAREERAGFLVLDTEWAQALSAGLKQRGVLTDARGRSLRFGPAPYLSDHQLYEAMQALAEAWRAL